MRRQRLAVTVRLAFLALLPAAAVSAGTVPGSAKYSGRDVTGVDDIRVASSAGRSAAAPGQTEPIPFDPFPQVTLPTTVGTVTLGGEPSPESHVLLVHSDVSVLGEQLWAGDPTKLLVLAPPDVHVVLASYAETPEGVAGDLAPMRAKIDAALAALTPDERDRWTGRIHYVTVNPLTVGGDFASLLEAWGTTVSTVRTVWEDDAGAHDLDLKSTPDSGWAAPITQTLTNQLAYYGRACGDQTPAQDVTGRFALIERGDCVFPEKVLNAERHGATGAILYDDGRGKLLMTGSCDPCPQIPALMIDRQPGVDMRAALEAGNPVTATIAPERVGAEMLGVDQDKRVREFGEVPYAFNSFLAQDNAELVDIMESVAYEVQYYRYEHARDRLKRSEEAAGALVFPMITDQWVSDPNWAGERAYAEVELPSAEEMAQYNHLEIELSLGCEDNRKAKCPIWDYIDNLYLCDADNPDHCDLEVARWITGYDTYGAWVTDISPMLGFLSEGGARRFAFYNQQRYRVDMSLRLSHRTKPVAARQAVELLPWRGGGFARDYNKDRMPIRFHVPEWAGTVELVAFITGHGGNDDNGCGEFCNHTHHFRVNNGPEHVLRNDVVDASNREGVFKGCRSRVADGVVANQGGTWVYGRAGWCPGLDVPPWTADITEDVRRGEWNMIDYRGLFNGQDYVSTYMGQTDPPPPSGWDARIDMRAYIVYSAAQGVPHGPVRPALGRWLFLPALGPVRE